MAKGIQTLFRKSEVCDTDTFKFILFAFINNVSFHLLLNFLFWIHSIHEKKYLWCYFNITQSKYFHSNGFSTQWNPWNTSTYCKPFPYYQSFRNLPQSQKLLKRFSKSSLPMQQPRPHNQLEPNYSLLQQINVGASLQIPNPQTIQKIIFNNSCITFTYPTNTPATASKNTHAFIHFSHHISENGCGATRHHLSKT